MYSLQTTMQNLHPEFLFHCQEAMARLCDVFGEQSFDKGKELLLLYFQKQWGIKKE
jgi:hypothetical protein